MAHKQSSVYSRKGTKAQAECAWIGGRRPSAEQVAAALDQLQEFRKGKKLGDDITLKELINEGRRY